MCQTNESECDCGSSEQDYSICARDGCNNVTEDLFCSLYCKEQDDVDNARIEALRGN